ELALVGVAARGRDVVELVEPLKPPEVSDAFIRLREAGGPRAYEAKFEGVRECIRHLERGGVVALLADRDYSGSGVCVDLWGRRMRVARGPFAMAERTGARLLPLFIERTWGATLTVHLEEPFCVEGSTGDEAVHAAAQRWASLFEHHP